MALKTLGVGGPWELTPVHTVRSLPDSERPGGSTACVLPGLGGARELQGLHTGTPWWLALAEVVSALQGRGGKEGDAGTLGVASPHSCYPCMLGHAMRFVSLSHQEAVTGLTWALEHTWWPDVPVQLSPRRGSKRKVSTHGLMGVTGFKRTCQPPVFPSFMPELLSLLCLSLLVTELCDVLLGSTHSEGQCQVSLRVTWGSGVPTTVAQLLSWQDSKHNGGSI